MCKVNTGTFIGMTTIINPATGMRVGLSVYRDDASNQFFAVESRGFNAAYSPISGEVTLLKSVTASISELEADLKIRGGNPSDPPSSNEILRALARPVIVKSDFDGDPNLLFGEDYFVDWEYEQAERLCKQVVPQPGCASSVQRGMEVTPS